MAQKIVIKRKMLNSLFKSAALLKRAFKNYKGRILLLGVLGFIASILGGIGASALVPLFAFILGKETGAADNTLIKWLTEFLEALPFTLGVMPLLAVVVSLFILRGGLQLAIAYIRSKIRTQYKYETIRKLFSDLVNAKWQFLLRQKMGNIQGMILRDAEEGAVFLESLARALVAIVTVVVFLGFAFALYPRVAVLSLLGGMIMGLFFRLLSGKIRFVGRKLSFKEKEVSQFIGEHMAGIKIVKSQGVIKSVEERGSKLFRGWQDFEFIKNFLRSILVVSVEPVAVLLVAIVFLASYRTPGFSLEVFAATIYLIQRTFVYLQSGLGAFQILNEIVPRIEYLSDMEAALSREREKDKIGRPFGFNKSLEFKGVSLAYLNGRTALSDVNFHLKKGEMVGLIGPSGSGKTSVSDLLMRLFTPASGAIIVDGVALEEFDLSAWRKKLGYVTQDIFLLNSTIEENIKFYDDTISDEMMIAAAKKANAYDFITKLDKGFKTIVGDRGVMLSGGERQRVVLARVLARNPEVLILDEATSELDSESEAKIQEAIKSLKGKVTILVIAHRLSTVVDLDRILVLDEGRIVEEGRPDKLLANPHSYFYRIYHLKEAV